MSSTKDPYSLGNHYAFIPRSRWRAEPPSSTPPPPIENKPIPNVIFTYNTGTKPCLINTQCEKAVRDLQKSHMVDQEKPDIGYNFIVGGDGKVYEGRGWDFLPERNDRFPELYGRSVEFGFIGNYENIADLPIKNVRNAIDYIRYSTYVLKQVANDYKLIESEPKIFASAVAPPPSNEPEPPPAT
ncbi:peptidoglycan-recognition protein SB2-like [Macrosteles quadrilineatus]|uniref:peptidoglycan-recognition protein SB2-like n=1 Tax=Macrosteles quadrilineatus TaxID=74068 RepID=UPI0023E19FA5|nr:peptidoglycan-recognition protein SB2-like [Macrosteles quadrilineatus]